MTKAEIKREIEAAKSELPYRADENLTVTEISLDYGGTISVWVTTSDELAQTMRSIGSFTMKENAKDHMASIDPDSSDLPERVRRILMQADIPVQYIFEDKFGSHLASIMLSKEAFEGQDRIGKEHQNPFAVRNVSNTKTE